MNYSSDRMEFLEPWTALEKYTDDLTFVVLKSNFILIDILLFSFQINSGSIKYKYHR